MTELALPQKSLLPLMQVKLSQEAPPNTETWVSKVVLSEHVDAVKGRPVPSTRYQTPGPPPADAPPQDASLTSVSISALVVE